jgi:hypothetical protein
VAAFRKQYTKPMPTGAEVFTRKGEQYARWTDGRGKKHVGRVTAGENGEPRLLCETAVYYANLRDEHGHLKTVSTGCKHEDNAKWFVSDWATRIERIKLGRITAKEYAVADHQTTPLAEHFDAYSEHLRVSVNRKTGFPACPKHRRIRRDHLNRVAKDLNWTTLADLKREQLEKWLADQATEGMGPRTRNSYSVSWSAFSNWCVDTHRLPINWFTRLGQANERADCRRQRRALTEAELVRLLDATWRRPLAERGRKPVKVTPAENEKRKRANWTYEPITPATIDDCERRAREQLKDRPELIAQLEAEGRARALAYKTLVLTGLRLNEARSLTVGAATLDGTNPYATLKAEDEKSRRGAEILLRADLAKDLSRHITERLRVQQQACKREERPIPARTPADAPLLLVPSDAIRALDRDLAAAGVSKRDERGRSFDMHAFRTTFNSLLAAADVPLTTRRILMRHAAEGVTDEYYTDKTLIDLRRALGLLPRLPLDRDNAAETQAATGTDGPGTSLPGGESTVSALTRARDQLAHRLAQTTGKTCTAVGSGDNSTSVDEGGSPAVSGDCGKACVSLVSGGEKRANGFEPSTFSLEG